ncbi:type IV toxin-antitoxin system AbiEi family antitoxin domain-containing protein [Aeromicrobium endophyticum]|uniref:Type IV toxin-antitoxin system AbiEi family antitoxin domain-containing protein n=1 Tax=Aeromicrobium endophyticum TaxID=2292704 RepID=A0A371P486_9ACTN|nr:type IV toxin-antitoxin system AbiEi family antitoxin domain-containing protein [Aeromicrobium endophyticum]REK70759.1 hypothetical protein DX116_16820 [Aeromicrobium endophyticum]
MDDLRLVIEINSGYVMRHQLNDIGHDDATIRRAMRAGILRRIRHGTYVLEAAWSHLSPTQRHCVLARSVLDKLGPGYVASHHTAAALLGLDVYGADLATVHVTRLDGRSGRREAGVVFHRGTVVPDEDVRTVGGLLVVAPIRAVFETCSQSSVEAGMVVASSAMRDHGIDAETMLEAGQQFAHWLGSRRARLAIRLSDGRLETVGEVRSLHMMWRHAIPRPELQHVIEDADGRFVARTDFTWLAARHTGEFDGLSKYGRLNPDRSDPGATVVAEKVREDAVREQLFGMSRWSWHGLDDHVQPETAGMIQRGIERSRTLYTRNAVHIPLS